MTHTGCQLQGILHLRNYTHDFVTHPPPPRAAPATVASAGVLPPWLPARARPEPLGPAPAIKVAAVRAHEARVARQAEDELAAEDDRLWSLFQRRAALQGCQRVRQAQRLGLEIRARQVCHVLLD